MLENVLLAVVRHAGSRNAAIAQAHELLDRVGLPTRHDLTAAGLSHGERRRLEVAVALGAGRSLRRRDRPGRGRRRPPPRGAGCSPR
ncbi:hypothetical protein [Streptomyces sp. NPDC051546]|uniref:hypothetical protein n=1 Tax=Streptomyces sp. NPDC051546 TaxID=3365655 RepID=UPI0037A8B5DE